MDKKLSGLPEIKLADCKLIYIYSVFQNPVVTRTGKVFKFNLFRSFSQAHKVNFFGIFVLNMLLNIHSTEMLILDRILYELISVLY